MFIEVIPIPDKKYENKFHKYFTKYLISEKLFVDFTNHDLSNKKQKYIEFYPFYCKNLILLILKNFNIFCNLNTNTNINKFFKKFNNISNIQNIDYMDFD